MPAPSTDPRYPIQFRIGRGLLARVDKAAWDLGVSRNTWVAEAVQARLRNGKTVRGRVTAAELMNDRVALMARFDELTLELLNEAAEEDDSTRTTWILDAILMALLRKGH
jgi:predicted HicB family RNase H-like nuclease